ncbi:MULTISPECIES: methyltransferase domain-containing protein [unclassified Kitasatospora]|uniref:methyltransferase domain-containing protein n=1 Tax=unclassified Kitasatospora TaxID=2633591 RepID=UPI0007109FA1|nr:MULTISPECIES: methyltransferase domain-containing protein [unclassified Kitasatospora]KQV16878.1 methyltransferase type 12 [Kitasatospora sp. Root107]KRB73679.1 methyltransferase type 12 [Kitasatospora sp. Root187]
MYPTRPRSALRTAVVWEVVRAALEQRAGDLGRPVLEVLDTGGGTGNFAVPVARLGHRVTVVDPSPDALFALERRAAEAGVTELVRAVQGDTQTLPELIEPGTVDAVLCHGVLEMVDDPTEALSSLTGTLAKGGLVSLLAANRNGAVLARALAGHFTDARAVLDAPDGRWGPQDPMPRRFSVEELGDLAVAAGLAVTSVHGVRVFADLVPGVLVDTEPGAMEALLKLEQAAAEQPAFHAVATQLHVLAALV